MSSIRDLIRPEELFALELEKTAMFDFNNFLLPSASVDKSAPNFVKIYMTNRSRMNLIMAVIGLQ